MKKLKHVLLTLLVIVTMFTSSMSYLKAWQYAENQAGSDTYIYLFEAMIAEGVETEQSVFEAIAYYNYLTPEGLDTFLKRGNIPSYVDDLIAVGRLPEGYTVSGGSTASTVPTPSVPTPSTPTPVAPAPDVSVPVDTTPTLDESKAGIYVVIKADTKSYETYNKKAEVKTWSLGEQVDVKGLMSNGYYKAICEEKEQYINKNNLTTLEKYNAAWEETERIDSVCEVAGSVTYVNSLTKETKVESIAPLSHEYLLAKETSPTCTQNGERTYICNTCGNEQSEVINATGHTEGEAEIIKRESFLFTRENPFIIDATATKCIECGETITTTESQINWKNIASSVILLGCIGGSIMLLNRRKRK